MFPIDEFTHLSKIILITLKISSKSVVDNFVISLNITDSSIYDSMLYNSIMSDLL